MAKKNNPKPDADDLTRRVWVIEQRCRCEGSKWRMLDGYMLGYCRNWSEYADGKPHSGEEYLAASLFICCEVFRSE